MSVARTLGFTLIEMLVIIAIIAVLAALLFPVLASAKESGKRSSCASAIRQTALATLMYCEDQDGVFPQTKPTSADPAIDDSAGQIEEPDRGPLIPLIEHYAGKASLLCPSDPDPKGSACTDVNPDAPEVTSYIINGYLCFGTSESQIRQPSDSVMYAERHSESPFCDYLFHPWYNASNPDAPENEMDEKEGAIASSRHLSTANYVFADSHSKALKWSQVYGVKDHFTLGGS